MKTRPTVLVRGYFAKNFGDDLFFKTLLDRYPHVRWDLLTSDKSYEKIFEGYTNVRVVRSNKNVSLLGRRINKFIELNEKILHYRRYAALLDIGGSIFMQGPNWQQMLSGREKVLSGFKRYGKGAFIIGANFGPYKTREFKDAYKEIFSRYDDICFRDQRSYRMFSDIANVRQAPDVIFGFNVKQYCEPKEKSVGISVIDLKDRLELRTLEEPYHQKLLELAETYIAADFDVKLFSFCEEEGDLAMAQRLEKKLPRNGRVRVINYGGRIDEFLSELASCRIIIGTRFHSIILALLFGQDLVPIAYSDKTYNVLADLNIQKHCCRIEDIGTMDVERAMLVAPDNKLKNCVPMLEAEKQFQGLDELLL